MNGVRCFFHAESIAKKVVYLSALCSYHSLRDSNVTEDSLGVSQLHRGTVLQPQYLRQDYFLVLSVS